MRRKSLAIVVVFVVWSILESILNRVILSEMYAATAELWRPEAEIKTGLLLVVLLVSSIVFVAIYCLLAKQGVRIGLIYGLILGIGAGISNGYGAYAVLPIPSNLALSGFLATVVEATIAGLLTGLIVKE